MDEVPLLLQLRIRVFFFSLANFSPSQEKCGICKMIAVGIRAVYLQCEIARMAG